MENLADMNYLEQVRYLADNKEFSWDGTVYSWDWYDGRSLYVQDGDGEFVKYCDVSGVDDVRETVIEIECRWPN